MANIYKNTGGGDIFGNDCSLRHPPRSNLTASGAYVGVFWRLHTSVVFIKQERQALHLTALQHTKTNKITWKLHETSYVYAFDNETVTPTRSAPDVRPMPSSPASAYKTSIYFLEILLFYLVQRLSAVYTFVRDNRNPYPQVLQLPYGLQSLAVASIPVDPPIASPYNMGGGSTFTMHFVVPRR